MSVGGGCGGVGGLVSGVGVRVGVGWFGWCGGVGGCACVGGVGGLRVPGVCAGWVVRLCVVFGSGACPACVVVWV